MDWNALWESISETLRIRLFEIAGTTLTLGSLLTFVVVLAGTIILSKLIRRGVDRWLKRSPVYSETSSEVAQKLAHYAVMLAGLVAAMQVIGIDLSTLFAAGAVFAVGIGFAMQNVAQNFVSGIILMVEQSIKPGDVLEVDGEVVRVQRMGIRSTIVRTRDEDEMIVPNSILAQGSVKNFTLTDSHYLVRGIVGVVYGSDMKLVKEVLTKTASDIPWRVEDKEPRVLMKEFGASSVDFNVFVWTDDPWVSRRLVSDLNERIWWALKGADITIAFPQLDVHFDGPVVDALKGRLQG